MLEHLTLAVVGLAGVAVFVAWNVGIGGAILLLWLAPMLVTRRLGYSRDRTGWLWGFWLGWLGVLILACMRAQPDRLEA